MASGQDNTARLEGTVSYKSSSNVYVTFESTQGIKEGDTIYIFKDNAFIPVLLVKNLSSISCVCEPISEVDLPLSAKVLAVRKEVAEDNAPEIIVAPVIDQPEDEIGAAAEGENAAMLADTSKKAGEGVHGRLSVSSYSDFSSQEDVNHQRMRYVLALNAKKIAGSGLSFDSYISFRHGNDDWDDIRDNVYNGLKIYNLSLNYAFNEDMILWFGRRINPKLSSMGAIDGLQFEKRFGKFTAGILAGSRPDWEDYSFNASLFQAGAYVNHQHSTDKYYVENTIAFVDQENKWNTDRRFLYLQHLSRLSGKLFFFGSADIDLYKYTNDKKETS
ncbi:MAG TPA: hypothetical protein VK994_02125, partial [Bacteroidales bacterium]|nr:hypothetical protein [Bacteroidales bacterium]